jgi:predicted metal-dependent TIM-barrel fold hydrolase
VGIGLDQVVIDHVDSRIIEVVRDFGSWMALSVQPYKISEKEAATLVQSYGSQRVMLDSDLAGGMSDVLSIPKAIFEMKTLGISAEDIRKVTYDNAVAFYRVAQLLP